MLEISVTYVYELQGLTHFPRELLAIKVIHFPQDGSPATACISKRMRREGNDEEITVQLAFKSPEQEQTDRQPHNNVSADLRVPI